MFLDAVAWKEEPSPVFLGWHRLQSKTVHITNM